MPFFVVSVALPVPLRKLFDYLPSADFPDTASYLSGVRCLVPFGKRKMTGIIIKVHKKPSVSMARLKAISQILDQQPSITNSTLTIYEWVAGYYHAPLGEVISAALPPPLRGPKHQHDLINRVSGKLWRITDQTDIDEPTHPPPRGAKQIALLELLKSHSEGIEQSKILSQGYSHAQLRNLQGKKLAQLQHEIILPDPEGALAKIPLLNPEQQAAFNALTDSAGKFSPILLYGVTGSGKTEVYIHWLHYLLEQNNSGQALVLVPEIALTPQTIRRFNQYFEGLVTCYHSGMSDNERLLSWLQTQQEKARIIIGTRSALLLPFTRLLTIIVDEEHDSSFKQQDGARYNARDTAIVRAQQEDCPVLLGSATPSFETLHNAMLARYQQLRLKQRHTKQPLPEFHLIDIKSRPLEGGISSPAMEIIRARLTKGEQVMVFINRRGFAPLLMCADCGWPAECTACDVRLTYHLQQNVLRCHHCDKTYVLPTQCPHCQSANIKPIGAGTERTEQALDSRFPDYPVIRVDRDNTQSKVRFRSLFEQINQGKPCIIVGTQMLAKGHDFPGLSTVIIVNADGGLFSSDFRAVEKTSQLLIQVAGRAGRRQQTGNVFIQTQFPEHPLLKAICKHDYDAIFRNELNLRRQAKFPPIYQLCMIRADAPDMDRGFSTLSQMKREMTPWQNSKIRLLGPIPSLLQRKQNRFHSLLWLLSEDRGELRRLLHNWLCWREDTHPKTDSGVKWQLDVDPSETL